MNSTTRGFHWTHFADKKVSDSSRMSVSLGAVAARVTEHSWLQALECPLPLLQTTAPGALLRS